MAVDLSSVEPLPASRTSASPAAVEAVMPVASTHDCCGDSGGGGIELLNRSDPGRSCLLFRKLFASSSGASSHSRVRFDGV